MRNVVDLAADLIWRPLCEATPICESTLSLPSRDTYAQAFPVLEPLSGYRMRLDIYVNEEGLEPRQCVHQSN